MQFIVNRRVIILVLAICKMIYAQPSDPLPTIILGGIGNVASTATNFLTGIVNRQKELLHRVTDTAADYINSAVERPRNLLINATRTTTGYIDSAASKGLEFKVRAFLENLRSRMRYGIPELNIPPLEPLQLDEIDIAIDNPEIGTIDLVIENLILRRLTTFVIKQAKLSLIGPTITVNLTIPKIYAEGHYNITGLIGDVYYIYGDGPFAATIYDFQLYVNTMLGYSHGMYMKTFNLDFAIGNISIYLENFMGGDETGQVLSRVFEELTPKVVDIIKPDILPGIQNYIASRANDTIHHLTMRDVLDVLLGQTEIRDLTHILVP